MATEQELEKRLKRLKARTEEIEAALAEMRKGFQVGDIIENEGGQRGVVLDTGDTIAYAYTEKGMIGTQRFHNVSWKRIKSDAGHTAIGCLQNALGKSCTTCKYRDNDLFEGECSGCYGYANYESERREENATI